MMNFEILRDAFIDLLGDSAAGRYTVVGYQKQAQSTDPEKTVQVYYSSGDFPKSDGSQNGPMMHHISFELGLTVIQAAAGDLSTLNDSAATQSELATALATFQSAAYLADRNLDELARVLYQIIMDARNQDLGLPLTGYPDIKKCASRWIESMRKDNPVDYGEYVVLTGAITVTCKIDEQVLGDTPVTMTEGVDVTMDFGDGLSGAGIQT